MAQVLPFLREGKWYQNRAPWPLRALGVFLDLLEPRDLPLRASKSTQSPWSLWRLRTHYPIPISLLSGSFYGRSRWKTLQHLSGPVVRDAARLSQRYPPYCALWGCWCLNMANWLRYPPPPFLSFSPLESMRSGGAIRRYPPPPPKKGYLSDTGAIPHETRQKACNTPLCHSISKGYCAISGGISHWAAKSSIDVSRESKVLVFSRVSCPVCACSVDFVGRCGRCL